jgi:hypothetical protein
MRSNLVLVCEFDIKMVSLENILILNTDFVFNNFKKRRGTSILNTALAG